MLHSPTARHGGADRGGRAVPRAAFETHRSMTLALVAVLCGLVLLVWSAERFVDGAAAVSRYWGMPPLLIGMIVVGFGTSAPEMAISARAAAQGHTGIALGNAYGSNIANIALILGLTALVRPIAVHSRVLRKELPVLSAVTLLAGYQLMDDRLTRLDALVLLAVFAGLLGWTIHEGRRAHSDALAAEMERELAHSGRSPGRAWFWLLAGLVILVLSARILVWGAVETARAFAVSDLIIGLTILAIGTSLPELASALAATRKGEHDIALGNVLGSNLFNTLVVVGIAAAIQPAAVPPEVLSRDWVAMGGLTLFLFILAYGFRGPGRVNRFEGGVLLASFIGYGTYLAVGVLDTHVA